MTLARGFVVDAPAEALDKAVLHRVARGDVMPFHTGLATPRQDRVAGEFGAIVADD